MAGEILRIGVVGAGGMGTVHISNYAHIPGAKVAAVCDSTDAGKNAAARLGVNAYGDMEEMLGREELDVVDVCTPTFLHKEHALAALGAGRHVICEKPVALSRADAKEMFDTARKNGVGLFIAQVLQYAPETAALRGLLKSGEYGKPLDAVFLRLSACPRWVKNGWLFDKSRSGLLPFDLHIHDLDLIVSLFGKPKTVGYTSGGGEGRAYKEFYRFAYGYDGLTVSAEAAWYNADFPFTATWRVVFENAVVVNDEKGVVAYPLEGAPRVFDTEEKIKIPTGINVPPTGIYLAELTDFLEKIRRGDIHDNREDEILAVMEILEQIQ